MSPKQQETKVKKPTRKKKERARRELEQATERASMCPGVNKKTGKDCGHKAGFGTSHKGFGYCVYHGGNLPGKEMQATKIETRHMAQTIPVSPGQAMAGVLHLVAGQLAWVTLKVNELDEEEIMTDYGVNRWVRLQRSIMQDVAKFAKTAADAGIDERMAKLAEEQTLMVGRLIEAVVKDPDFDMTPAQKKILGPLVRKHLTMAQDIEGTASNMP